MTATRTLNNNLSPESIAILRKIHETFASPEFFIGGGITTLAASYFVYNHETEQTAIIISTAMGIVLIGSGLALTKMRTYHLPQRNPLDTPRDTSPTKSSAVPHPKETHIKPTLPKARRAERQRLEKGQKNLRSKANLWWTKSKERISTLIKKYRFTSQSVTPPVEENKTIEETNFDIEQKSTKHFSSTQKTPKNKKTQKNQKNNFSKKPRQIPSSQRSSSVAIMKGTSGSKNASNTSLTGNSETTPLPPPETLKQTLPAISVSQENSLPQVLNPTEREEAKTETQPALISTPVTVPSSAPSAHLAPDQQGWTYALEVQQKAKLLEEENKWLKKQIRNEQKHTNYYFNLSNELAASIMSGTCYPYYYFFSPVTSTPEPIVAETSSLGRLSRNGRSMHTPY